MSRRTVSHQITDAMMRADKENYDKLSEDEKIIYRLKGFKSFLDYMIYKMQRLKQDMLDE